MYGAVNSAGVTVPVCLRRPAHLDMLRARFRVVAGALDCADVKASLGSVTGGMAVCGSGGRGSDDMGGGAKGGAGLAAGSSWVGVVGSGDGVSGACSGGRGREEIGGAAIGGAGRMGRPPWFGVVVFMGVVRPVDSGGR